VTIAPSTSKSSEINFCDYSINQSETHLNEVKTSDDRTFNPSTFNKYTKQRYDAL